MRLSEKQRWNIVLLHEKGTPRGTIAEEVQCDPKTVDRWIHTYEDNHSVQEKEGRGRKRKLSNAQEADVARQLQSKRGTSTRRLAKKLKTSKGIDVSYSTIERTAHRRGLKSYSSPVSSKLSPSIIEKRLAFAKTYKNKDWSNVIFSDEHSFKPFRPGNRRHKRRWATSRDKVPVVEVERFQKSLNVWAGISLKGKTPLHFYEGTLTSEDYQAVLEETLLPAASEMFDDEDDQWELVQDKATCHASKSTKNWLDDHNIAWIKEWPTKGDDINPIENLWAILDERLEQKKFTTFEGIKKAITEIWNDLEDTLVPNLIKSVPNRIKKVIKAKGGHTKNTK